MELNFIEFLIYIGKIAQKFDKNYSNFCYAFGEFVTKKCSQPGTCSHQPVCCS